MNNFNFEGIEPPKTDSQGNLIMDSGAIPIDEENTTQEGGIFQKYTTNKDVKDRVQNILEQAYKQQLADQQQGNDDFDIFNIEPQTTIYAKGPQKQLLKQTLNSMGIEGQKRDFLMKSAYIESGYRLNSKASASSASGWFGFLDSTRNRFSDTSREQFLRSPQEQVLAASKLYDYNLANLQNSGLLDIAHKKGISTNEAIAMSWLNPSWARTFITTGKSIGADAFGTTAGKYLSKFRSIKIAKEGGKLSGDILTDFFNETPEDEDEQILDNLKYLKNGGSIEYLKMGGNSPASNDYNFVSTVYPAYYNAFKQKGLDVNTSKEMATMLTIQDAHESGYGTNKQSRFFNYGGLSNQSFKNVNDYVNYKIKLMEDNYSKALQFNTVNNDSISNFSRNTRGYHSGTPSTIYTTNMLGVKNRVLKNIQRYEYNHPNLYSMINIEDQGDNQFTDYNNVV